MKLKEKIKIKGKIHRKYDIPKTPYQRLMESPHIQDETKRKLEALYLSLNPAELKRNIDEKLKSCTKPIKRKITEKGRLIYAKDKDPFRLHFK